MRLSLDGKLPVDFFGLLVVCLWSVCGLFVVCLWSVCGLFVVCLWVLDHSVDAALLYDIAPGEPSKVVANLAAASATSFPVISEWPGIR